MKLTSITMEYSTMMLHTHTHTHTQTHTLREVTGVHHNDHLNKRHVNNNQAGSREVRCSFVCRHFLKIKFVSVLLSSLEIPRLCDPIIN